MPIETGPAIRTIEILDAAKARNGGKLTIEAQITAILAYRQITAFFAPVTEKPLEALELFMKEEQMFQTMINTLAPDLVNNPVFEQTAKMLKASMEADLADIRKKREARG